jgi:hypothetical protein
MKNSPFDLQDFVPRSDCCVAAAIIGAGALGAGASIYGANKAAEAQTSYGNQSIDASKFFFKEAESQLQPYISAGHDTLPSLQGFTDPNNPASPLAALMRLTMPGSDQSAALAETPGFKFTQQYGMKGIENALAARGLAGPGGPLARAGADYSSGLASTTWQNVVNALLSSFQGGANSLQNIVNTGAGAAGTLTGAATQTGGQVANSLVGIGNAQAGAATATGNAIGQFGSSIPQALLLQKLLGNGGSSAGGGPSGLYGLANGTYGNFADAGFGNGIGTGGFNFIDAMAAKGGRFKKGQRILVGEEGPEIIEMPGDGTIIPNNAFMALVKTGKRKPAPRATRH